MSTINAVRDAELSAVARHLKIAEAEIIRREVEEEIAAKGGRRELLLPEVLSRCEILFAGDRCLVRARTGVGDETVTVAALLDRMARDPEKMPAFARQKLENPFRKDTWNMTRQFELRRANPSLASQLEAEAKAQG